MAIFALFKENSYFCNAVRPTGENIHNYSEWDTPAFRLLYNNYYKALSNYAYQILNDYDGAEDVVQSVFVTIWETRPDFSSVCSMEAWLYNSVRNKCLNTLKHRGVEQQYAKAVSAQEGDHAITNDELFEERVYRMLFDTIDRLPARSREVFLLYMDGKSNKAIAEALDISIETVKTHKKRSMAFLRKELGPERFDFMLYFLFAGTGGSCL